MTKVLSYNESAAIIAERMTKMKREAEADGLDPRAFATTLLSGAVVSFHFFGVPLDSFQTLVEDLWQQHDNNVCGRIDA